MKNVSLLKESPMPLAENWEATYTSDTLERQTRFFNVLFQKMDGKGGHTGENFTVAPNVMYDRQFTKVAASNPDTKHYWNRDIFTSIAALPPSQIDAESAKAAEDSLSFVKYEGKIGDTIFNNGNIADTVGRAGDLNPCNILGCLEHRGCP